MRCLVVHKQHTQARVTRVVLQGCQRIFITAHQASVMECFVLFCNTITTLTEMIVVGIKATM